MTRRQIFVIFALVLVGLVVPWFSVGMFFMGAACGAFLSVVLK